MFEITQTASNLIEDGSYKLGKKDGTWKYYAGNGPLIRESNYSEGLRNGKEIIYSGNGKEKLKEMTFKENMLHGSMKIYKNGTLEKEEKYQMGRKIAN